MKVINIEIRCDMKKDKITPVLTDLCANHLIAGSTHQEIKTLEWVGGQLTNKTVTLIKGITKTDLLDNILQLLPKECLLTTVLENNIKTPEFEEWFRMHL
jgi:hypothetical protein